jgi:hypothetical protein
MLSRARAALICSFLIVIHAFAAFIAGVLFLLGLVLITGASAKGLELIILSVLSALVALFVFGVGVFVSVNAWFRLRRLPIEACKTCGYDLRGNPSAVMCPECGAVTTPGEAGA